MTARIYISFTLLSDLFTSFLQKTALSLKAASTFLAPARPENEIPRMGDENAKHDWYWCRNCDRVCV